MGLSFFKNTVFIPIVIGMVLICFSCGNTFGETNSKYNDGLDNFIDNGKVNQKDSIKEPKIGRLITSKNTGIKTAANLWQKYMPLLKDKKVGIVANQTSVVNDTLTAPNETRVVDFHLVDFIYEFDNQVVKVFAPEHGFRGTADAGEAVKDGIDSKTRIPIISLYGKNKKPSPEQLAGIEVMVFDIQDVGARFYTYISTLHYVMEACAEANIPVIVLDRPNPNGHYTDGPILEKQHKSFVGMHPVPVVHGMTIGEYAQMINGEGWLENNSKCDLTIIKMENYTHKTSYSLPIKPSPNLPNDIAINLYPSLCFFEGSIVSAGRGTDNQFQIFGAPSLPKEFYKYSFTPQANVGAKYPKFKEKLCHGKDLRNTKQLDILNLKWLIEAYVANGKKTAFFNNFFTKLAGTEKLQKQIEQGYTYPEIRKTWLKDLEKYDVMRKQYLLYP
ncbi:exo-beta-N-acetylmuramidase NamZ domain-containing protein [Patiriisocius sp. Uisw_017]|jgi:uncharacterized protein YbbC (DUF1343 family)|uniref:exo-beta-N-acetylmuramidase NamZ family protein n=1 Tax=Patiriisocius sp. Uisw_017 TaxID=3230968 RepID=UPI0039E76770